MTGQLAIVWTSMGAAAAAVALLRFAWGQAARSARLTAGAWGLLLAGLVLAASAHGAWGLALATLAAMGSAAALLMHAALATSQDQGPERDVRIVLEEPKALHIGRRLVTFLIAVPAALLVALLVGLAARALASFAGWPEANANVATLFLMPITWAILDVLLLMTPRRAVQGYILLVPALASGTILLADITL